MRVAAAVEIEVDHFVAFATQGFSGQLGAGLEGIDSVLEQFVLAGFACGRGNGEVHAAHFQVLQQAPGEFRQGREVGTFQAQFGALTPTGDLLTLVVIDRVAVAAALADFHFLDLAGLLHRLVHGLGDFLGQFARIGVLRFAVQGHGHQVARHFLADFGTQRDLVVAWFFCQRGQAGEQAGGHDEGGAAAGVKHV
ncbi:hypothetical protein D3C84_565810 [compost metagenome]